MYESSLAALTDSLLILIHLLHFSHGRTLGTVYWHVWCNFRSVLRMMLRLPTKFLTLPVIFSTIWWHLKCTVSCFSLTLSLWNVQCHSLCELSPKNLHFSLNLFCLSKHHVPEHCFFIHCLQHIQHCCTNFHNCWKFWCYLAAEGDSFPQFETFHTVHSPLGLIMTHYSSGIWAILICFCAGTSWSYYTEVTVHKYNECTSANCLNFLVLSLL